MSELVIILFILAISRVLIALREQRGALITDGDAMAHLTFVKEYYKNRGMPIDLSYKYILEGEGYPNGFHKLLYLLRFSIGWLEKWGGFLPTFFDLLLYLTLAIVVYQFGGNNYEWLILFPMMRLLWGNKGRAAHLSERAFGVLLGNLYLITIFLAYLTEIYWILSLSIAFFTVAVVSSKFTIQALTFFTIILSVALLDIYFVTTLFTCFIASVIITNGYSYQVLSGAVRHSQFYRTHLAKINPTVKDSYRDLFSLSGGLKRTLGMWLRNSLLRIFTDTPPIVGIAIVLILNGYEKVLFEWYIWLGAGILLVALISTKWLSFLGEPERYLEYALIPMFVILSFYPVSNNAPAFYLSLLAAITIIAFEIVLRLYNKPIEKNKKQKDMIELREFFKSIAHKTVITAPFRLSFFLGYDCDANRFVTLFSNIGEGYKQDEYKWLCPEMYPWPRRDIRAISKRYQVDIFALDYKTAESLAIDAQKKYYETSSFIELFRNDNYVVFSLNNG